MKFSKKFAVVFLALALTFTSILPASAATMEEDESFWPEGSYYNPYDSIADLPENIPCYSVDSPEERFNTITYFYVDSAELEKEPSTVLRIGYSDNYSVWAIAIPNIENANRLVEYCAKNEVGLVQISHVVDGKPRTILLGIPESDADSRRVMIGGQAAFCTNAVFGIQMVDRSVKDGWVKCRTWSIDNLGYKMPDEDGYMFLSDTVASTQPKPRFSCDSAFLTEDVENYAIECIKTYANSVK